MVKYSFSCHKWTDLGLVLDDRIDEFADLVQKFYHIDEFADPSAATEVWLTLLPTHGIHHHSRKVPL